MSNEQTKSSKEFEKEVEKEVEEKVKNFFEKKCKKGVKDQGGNAFYGIGLIGALVYYISTATGFWMGVWGVIKAVLWPAFFVYKIFEYLGM